MADSRDITGKNRKFTGTGGIKLPVGTEAQRVNEQAQIRFNTDTNLAEYYNGTEWKPIDSPPVITGFTIDDIGGTPVTSGTIDATAGGTSTIEILGSLFDTTGAVVTFPGTGETLSTASITRNSATKLTVTVTRADFDNTNEPYSIKVTNGSGLSAELSAVINQDQAPVFTNASGNIGVAFDGLATTGSTLDAGATDPDGDTVTHTITSGVLPTGMTIASATGYITGTPSGTNQDYTFTVQAATSTQSSSRSFTITKADPPSGGTVYTEGDYRVHAFTSSGTFTIPTGVSITADHLVVAGGGGDDETGSGGQASSGGGAGGAILTTSQSISSGSYTVTVGGGGSTNSTGDKGSPSSFNSVTAEGGGGGTGSEPYNPSKMDGGSGGGGGLQTSVAVYNPAGSGTPGQGNPGGNASPNLTGGAGGGGGKGAAGESAPPGRGGNGGVGVDYSPYFGTSYGESGFFAGGGGGGGAGTPAPQKPHGTGGTGGGANGNPGGRSGTANTGGGAGGDAGSGNNGIGNNSGGSGIVLIRYQL